MRYEPTEWDKYFMTRGAKPEEPEPEPGTWDAMMDKLVHLIGVAGVSLLAFAAFLVLQ